MAIIAGVMEVVGLRAARRVGAHSARSSRCGPALPLAIAGARLGRWRRCRCRLPCRSSPRWPAVTALGPLLYRIAYQPVAEASRAGAPHRLGRRALRAARPRACGSSAPRARARRRSSSASFTVGAINVSVQSLLVVGDQRAADRRALPVLRSHAVRQGVARDGLNRVGARLCGVSPSFAGALTFTLASLLCAFCGVLIGPITTVYYDSGFLVVAEGVRRRDHRRARELSAGRRRRAARRLDRVVRSFWASAFKEVIVFTLIIPVLLWRSLTTHHHEEEE